MFAGTPTSWTRASATSKSLLLSCNPNNTRLRCFCCRRWSSLQMLLRLCRQQSADLTSLFSPEEEWFSCQRLCNDYWRNRVSTQMHNGGEDWVINLMNPWWVNTTYHLHNKSSCSGWRLNKKTWPGRQYNTFFYKRPVYKRHEPEICQNFKNKIRKCTGWDSV